MPKFYYLNNVVLLLILKWINGAYYFNIQQLSWFLSKILVIFSPQYSIANISITTTSTMFSYISLSPIDSHHILRGSNISCSNIEYLTHIIQRFFPPSMIFWFTRPFVLLKLLCLFLSTQIGFLGQIWYMILWWDPFAILHRLSYLLFVISCKGL